MTMCCSTKTRQPGQSTEVHTFWERARMATCESTSVVEAVSTAVTFSCKSTKVVCTPCNLYSLSL